jgi:hypothetical protein
LVFCSLGYDTHMGSIKCPLVFWLVCANCARESVWSMICNLEIYEFTKLQSCSLTIWDLQFCNFVIFNMHNYQVTKVFVCRFSHLKIFKFSNVNLHILTLQFVIFSCCKFLEFKKLQNYKLNCNIVMCKFVTL